MAHQSADEANENLISMYFIYQSTSFQMASTGELEN